MAPRAGATQADHTARTERLRSGWSRAGHEPLLRELEPAAGVVAELAQLEPGARVVDAAAGDGNVAVTAARRGCRVDACDLAAAMIERGRVRCAWEGLPVAWQVDDLQALGYEDALFDAVVSNFGASWAPRALTTARELVRVCRPGGVVALAAFVPRGLPGRFEEIIEPVSPPSDGIPAPAAWGVDRVARRRLEPLLDQLELRTRTLTLRFGSSDDFFDALARPHSLDQEQRAKVRPSFDRLLSSCNNRRDRVEVNARYLVAIGRRPDD